MTLNLIDQYFQVRKIEALMHSASLKDKNYKIIKKTLLEFKDIVQNLNNKRQHMRKFNLSKH